MQSKITIDGIPAYLIGAELMKQSNIAKAMAAQSELEEIKAKERGRIRDCKKKRKATLLS